MKMDVLGLGGLFTYSLTRLFILTACIVAFRIIINRESHNIHQNGKHFFSKVYNESVRNMNHQKNFEFQIMKAYVCI